MYLFKFDLALTRHPKRNLVFVGLLTASLATALPASGVSLLYDGFSDDDPNLVSNGGGEGWSGSWGNSGVTIAHLLSNDDVSLSGPATSGDRVLSTGGEGAASASAHRLARAFTPLDVSIEGEVYMSYLIKKSVVAPTSQNNLEVGLLPPSGTSGGIIRTGSGSDEALLLAVTGTGALLPDHPGNTFVENETYLVVAKIITSPTEGGDSVGLSMFSTASALPIAPPSVWDLAWGGDITAATGLGRAQLWTGYQSGGEFDELRAGTTWSDVVITASGPAVGDFNGDGFVNLADFTVWRDNLGGDESTLNGAGDGIGVVDTVDYDLWKMNFGASSGAVSAIGSPVSIPEPGTLVLLVCTTMLAVGKLAHKRFN